MKKWRILSAILVMALLLTGGVSASAAKDKGYEIGNAAVSSWTSALGGTSVLVYYEVTNTSEKNLFCSAGSVELEDADGNLVGTSDTVSVYPQIIRPGETAYYTDTVYLDELVESELVLYPKAKVKEATVPYLALDVSDFKIQKDSLGFLNAIGRVKNYTGEDIDAMIYVVALLYAEDGAFLGSMFDILTEDMEDGDRLAFDMSGLMLPRSVTLESVASYKLFGYPNQYQFG